MTVEASFNLIYNESDRPKTEVCSEVLEALSPELNEEGLDTNRFTLKELEISGSEVELVLKPK